MDKLLDFYETYKKWIVAVTIAVLLVLFAMPFITTKSMERHCQYTEKAEVALYLMQYNELPSNYITKYGYIYMENHNLHTNGFVMGGDTHINDGKLLDFGIGKDATLKECDIAGKGYDIGGKRGAQRLVYTCNTNNVRVFYTDDHYSSFEEITIGELQTVRDAFWVVFACYVALMIGFYSGIIIIKKKKGL